MKYSVIDLFSGAGGMSYGFKSHSAFEVIASVDAQRGKPSNGHRKLDCNSTYYRNIGIKTIEKDLNDYLPENLSEDTGIRKGNVDVLISCAPCTGFSRTNPNNHIVDDDRNSLVLKSFKFVKHFRPALFLMENARELLMGRFSDHFEQLKVNLIREGYSVSAKVHFLNSFGLPQRRERALVIATRKGLQCKDLEEIWRGYKVSEKYTHVRNAIGHLPPIDAGETHPEDSMHLSPKVNLNTLYRLQAIPKDGGSWRDLVGHMHQNELLTPAMKRYVKDGKFGSHPDVYGRMWWDRPSVTIKRECGHVGNGRYSHPEQDRLCTVREMGILQGFPKSYIFESGSLTNMYRHIGDAVPPLISYQLAHLCNWILSEKKPRLENVILKNTSLSDLAIERSPVQLELAF